MQSISKLITFNLTDLVIGAKEYMTQVIEHNRSRWLNRFLSVCRLAGKKKIFSESATGGNECDVTGLDNVTALKQVVHAD